MAFRTPVDYGFAQVIDNSGLVNAYAQQQLQRNKEAQLQQKEVADQLAKINTNGIKEADIPHINEQFDRLRDIGNQARMAAGTSQALQKQAEFDKAAREMSYNIEQSKASNQLYQDRLKFKGENHPEELDPDYDTRLSAIKDISTFSPDYKVVTNDVDKLYTKRPTVDLMKDVFSPIVEKSYTTNTEETKVGNRFVSERMKSASPEFIANNIATTMLSNPRVSAKIMDTYYDAFNQTDQNHDKAEATQRGFKNYDPTKFNDYVALQALRLARPKQVDESSKGEGKQVININTGNGQVESGTAVSNYAIPFINQGEAVNGKLKDVQSETVARKGLNLNIPSTVVVTNAIDRATGKPISDAGAQKGTILGIYQMPVYKPTGGLTKSKTVDFADKKGDVKWEDRVWFKTNPNMTTGEESKEYFIPLSNVPIDKASTKTYKELGVTGNIKEANKTASVQNTVDLARKQEVPTEARGKKVKGGSSTPSMFR